MMNTYTTDNSIQYPQVKECFNLSVETISMKENLTMDGFKEMERLAVLLNLFLFKVFLTLNPSQSTETL